MCVTVVVFSQSFSCSENSLIQHLPGPTFAGLVKFREKEEQEIVVEIGNEC